ncbi:MAG: response regulator [Acidobacteriia bacterium]|nr:response regulator [Terriglobia bacterium]MBV8905862.1 response regulator [Terriglobia bacterium]MBV9742158.1 response regulator [Terriglobia bacterium]
MAVTESKRQITVLFAEDEADLRKLFERVFKSNGFHVMTACNGREALQLAKEYDGHIDLLVSNVHMPEMTGPDLARELRKSRSDIKIMLMSGNPDGLLLLDSGWLFLSKPVLPADVIKKIEHILERPPAPEVDRGPESGFPEH